MFLSNPTDQTYSYKITFEDKEMNKKGNVQAVPIEKTFSHSLKKYLRVFPRSVIIPPGNTNSQEIQIQLKGSDSLPDGEYRSFITFSPLEENTNTKKDSVMQGTKIAVKFQMAISIPIIYRKNATLGQVSIDSLSLTSVNDSIKLLNICIKRDGNRSIYGKLNVVGYVNGAPVTLFASKSNVVMYCEIPELNISVPVNLKSVDRAANGKVNLDIVYIDTENNDKIKSNILIKKQVELILPKKK